MDLKNEFINSFNTERNKFNINFFTLNKVLTATFPFYIIKPIAILTNFLTISFISKKIGVDGYGNISLILAITSFFMLFFDFRSNEAVTNFYSRYTILNEPDKAKLCILLGFFLDIILAIIFVAFFYLFASLISGIIIHNKSVSLLLQIYAVSASLLFMSGTPFAILQSEYRFWLINIADLCREGIKLAWVYFVAKDSLNDIILAYVVSNIFYFLLLFYFSLHKIMGLFQNVPFKYSRQIAKEFYGFTFKTFLSTLIKAGERDMDKIILGYFTNVGSVGIYDIIKRIAGLISWLIFPLPTTIYPSLVKLFNAKQYREMKKAINSISLVVTVISLIISIGIFAFRDYIFLFFHFTSQDDFSFILLIFLFSNILLNSLWWSRVFVNSINKPEVSIYMNIAKSILFILFLVILTRFFGILGTSIAVIITTLIISFAWFYFYRLELKMWRNKGVYS